MIQILVKVGHRTKNTENLVGIWWNNFAIERKKIKEITFAKTSLHDI